MNKKAELILSPRLSTAMLRQYANKFLSFSSPQTMALGCLIDNALKYSTDRDLPSTKYKAIYYIENNFEQKIDKQSIRQSSSLAMQSIYRLHSTKRLNLNKTENNRSNILKFIISFPKYTIKSTSSSDTIDQMSSIVHSTSLEYLNQYSTLIDDEDISTATEFLKDQFDSLREDLDSIKQSLTNQETLQYAINKLISIHDKAGSSRLRSAAFWLVNVIVQAIISTILSICITMHFNASLSDTNSNTNNKVIIKTLKGVIQSISERMGLELYHQTMHCRSEKNHT